jgi:hypothetical protein
MEWKRNFLLTRVLNPTRASVIGLDTDRISLTAGWNFPTRLHKDATALEQNLTLLENIVERLASEYGLVDAASHDAFKDLRVNSRRNKLIEAVPVAEILADFMLRFRVPDYADSSLHTVLTMALNAAMEKNPDELCDVFVIGNLEPQMRTLTPTGRINQLFVGKSPNTDDFEKLTYVGDAALFGSDRLALQLRTYDLRVHRDGPAIATHVPWYALHLPQRMIRDAVIEDGSSV